MKMNLKFVKGIQAKVLVLACLAVIPQLALAVTNQVVSSAGHDELKLVPSLGYSYFNIQGATADYKAKGGNSAGILVQMPMTDSAIELESGLEYLETGAKQTFDFGFLSIDAATLSIGQLAVPLRAKYIFNPTGAGTHWYGRAGLTPTYVMSAKSDVMGQSADVKSDVNSFGVLTQAGIGAEWSNDMIPGRITMDLTYSYGLTKVFKIADGKASGFQLQAGYSFHL